MHCAFPAGIPVLSFSCKGTDDPQWPYIVDIRPVDKACYGHTLNHSDLGIPSGEPFFLYNGIPLVRAGSVCRLYNHALRNRLLTETTERHFLWTFQAVLPRDIHAAHAAGAFQAILRNPDCAPPVAVCASDVLSNKPVAENVLIADNRKPDCDKLRLQEICAGWHLVGKKMQKVVSSMAKGISAESRHGLCGNASKRSHRKSRKSDGLPQGFPIESPANRTVCLKAFPWKAQQIGRFAPRLSHEKSRKWCCITRSHPFLWNIQLKYLKIPDRV